MSSAATIRLLERLEKGSLGAVWKAVDTRTQDILAVKIINLEEAEDCWEDIRREVSVLVQCDNPHVARYYGSFVKDRELWILFEYLAGGSLRELLTSNGGPLDEAVIAVVMREVLEGLVYLHDQSRVHRDIKAANLLLSASGEVKLAEFGVSGQLTNSVRRFNTMVGTPFWMAPEVIKQVGYDTKADIWSVGITAIELATGAPPYFDQHPMRVLLVIPKCEPPTLDASFSRPFREFVSLCLRMNSADRPTARELLKHKFIKSARRGTAAVADLLQTRVQSAGQMSGVPTAALPNAAQPAAVDAWDFDTIRAGTVKAAPPAALQRRVSTDGSATPSAGSMEIAAVTSNVQQMVTELSARYGDRSEVLDLMQQASVLLLRLELLQPGAGHGVAAGFSSVLKPPSEMQGRTPLGRFLLQARQ
eukprot:TRINITY_DN4453_c0_g1_i1.p1 TRINITY_DN4453_c0_g1~~TRINITY_DN4453_c0_g1_i1.p1  ORF type:complete len:419 (-),score=70.10 TRINITY_DN4453_c0_g1_i1:116-1372(-)